MGGHVVGLQPDAALGKREPVADVARNLERWVDGIVIRTFSQKMLEELHAKLLPLETAWSPFKKKVKDEAVTTWVRPKLVAEVRFAEWTENGEMRHPAFIGLREDKRAEDVVLEKEVPRPR